MDQLKELCSGVCEGLRCPAKARVYDTLRTVFQYESFRPGQLEASLAALHGRDVLVHMATGGGKTLCMFLVPLSVSDTAMAVVISPLNALIEQQINQLRAVGIAATQAGASNFSDVADGNFRFVFMSPESAVKPPWCKVFGRKDIVLVAVDEAHCVHEWGQAFRTSFSRLGGLRALTSAPFMALTAIASPENQKVIAESLMLSGPEVITCSLNRPNIFYSVSPISGHTVDLAGVAALLRSKSPASVPKILLFTGTKNMACKLSRWLSLSAASKQYVSAYHASLTKATRTHLHQQFQAQTSLRCLVATIAYGMGMDISDVQLVLVYGYPETMNLLSQLCGRAGRGGGSSRAHVFYSTKQKHVDAHVEKYCVSKENCRRQSMLQALGAAENHPPGLPRCDVCNFGRCPAQLHFEAQVTVTSTHRKRRTALKDVGSDHKAMIKNALIKEREEFIEEHPSYRMLGASFVCPDSLIEAICVDTRFVQNIDDLNSWGLRPELKSRFFNSIANVLSLCPPAAKRRRCV